MTNAQYLEQLNIDLKLLDRNIEYAREFNLINETMFRNALSSRRLLINHINSFVDRLEDGSINALEEFNSNYYLGLDESL